MSVRLLEVEFFCVVAFRGSVRIIGDNTGLTCHINDPIDYTMPLSPVESSKSNIYSRIEYALSVANIYVIR
jgi:hypothetical protein